MSDQNLQTYDVVVNGTKTRMRMSPSYAATYHPGAVPVNRPRHKAILAPQEPDTVTPVTTEPQETPPATSAQAVHKGGGWYELPDGTRVQGLKAVQEALGEIDGDES